MNSDKVGFERSSQRCPGVWSVLALASRTLSLPYISDVKRILFTGAAKFVSPINNRRFAPSPVETSSPHDTVHSRVQYIALKA
jgi:hypothetical protein